MVPIILSVLLVWYSLSKVPLSKIVEEAKEANYWWILLSVVCVTLSHMSRAYRWRFMLEPLGYNIKYKNSLMAVFSAYLINYGIPRSGEVARATILTNYEDVPFEKGFGTIVAERIADLILMLLIIATTLILQFEFIYKFFSEKLNANLIYVVITLIPLSIIGLLILRKSKHQLILKIKGFINGLIEGMLSIFKMKKKWAFIFHSFFIWGMYLLMFYTTTFAFESLKDIPIAAVLIGFISGSFSFAATNGGTGSFPVAIYAAFSLFGIPEEPSTTFGWVLWGSQTLMTILCGALSLIYLPIYNKEKKLV